MMKNIYFILSLTLLLSCAKDKHEAIPETAPPPQLTADEYRAIVALKPHHTISFDEAKQQAIEAASLFDNDTQTKASPKSILDGLAITANTIGLTKSEALGVDTLIYLFNYANDEGYVFISADERAPGILAYIEDGYFNIQDSIECPGAAMLFSGMEVLVRQEIDRTEFLKDSLGETATAKYNAITQHDNLLAKGSAGSVGENNGPIGPPTYKTEYTKQNPNYGTIVQTNWTQTSPFDDLLPSVGGRTHAYVGCVPVVIAQIMAHFNYPEYYQGVPLYLSELRQYRNWYDFSTPSVINKIAIFSKFIFDNVNTGYDGSGTSSNYEKARWFLRAMGYSTPWDVVHYNFGDVKASIDSGWLVYTRGYSHRTNNFLGIAYSYSGGHAWIIDHYTNITKTIYEVKVYSNKVVTKTPISSTTTMHIHCNMGYGKDKNGYYIDGVFNASVIPEVKTKSNVDYNFQYKVEIAPRIR